MNIRLKKALTVVGATAALALVVSACSSASGKVTASSIDCSQSIKDRIAVVNAAADKVNVDQKALTKASGTPDEQSAKDKLKTDTQTRDALDKQNKACTSASPSPSPSGVPADWTTIYYSKLPGVPTGYFGPKSACIQTKSPGACRQDLETTWQHDPDILSVWLVHFNLLPGQQDLVAKLTAAHQSQAVIDQQVEALRQKFAQTLADYKQRKLWQPKAAAVLDSIPDLTIQPLSGVYYTTYIDSSGAVHQTTKDMNPAINVAIMGTLPSGQVFEDKLDCHHQPVSKKPIPNVPTTPSPSPSCKQFPNPYGPGFVFDFTVCNWVKPPQSKNCMLNGSWTQGCPPNQADQPVQSNPGQPVGKTSGAPTQAPPYNPPATAPQYTPEPTGPGVNSGGGTGGAAGGKTCQQDGTCVTSSPSPTTSPSPNPGNTGVTHSPAPSDSGMPSMPS